MISLSSMESELFALQHVAQKMSSLGRIVARILRFFKRQTCRKFQEYCFQTANRLSSCCATWTSHGGPDTSKFVSSG